MRYAKTETRKATFPQAYGELIRTPWGPIHPSELSPGVWGANTKPQLNIAVAGAFMCGPGAAPEAKVGAPGRRKAPGGTGAWARPTPVGGAAAGCRRSGCGLVRTGGPVLDLAGGGPARAGAGRQSPREKPVERGVSPRVRGWEYVEHPLLLAGRYIPGGAGWGTWWRSYSRPVPAYPRGCGVLDHRAADGESGALAAEAPGPSSGPVRPAWQTGRRSAEFGAWGPPPGQVTWRKSSAV